MTYGMNEVNIDTAAHRIMSLWKMQDVSSRYTSMYHEDKLYSIYDMEQKTVTLMCADSKKDLMAKVKALKGGYME